MSIAEKKQVLIIFGPTGVGKTDFVLEIAKSIKSEIINADLGQFYSPLSIGTAKPDWKNETTAHHLFDILDTPSYFTVVQYRQILEKKLQEIWARGNLPIIVGGSGFYIKSFFFPLTEEVKSISDVSGPDYEEIEADYLWQELYNIDPVRAQALHKHDKYRIVRALELWHKTGKRPSDQTVCYQPLADNVLLLCLNRDRQELYARIDNRVHAMFDQGWESEVRNLIGTEWEAFLEVKKIIGYDDLLAYCKISERAEDSLDLVIKRIQQRSRHYAKRQLTFWRMLEKEIKKHSSFYENTSHVEAQMLDLTSLNLPLYIKGLLRRFCNK